MDNIVEIKSFQFDKSILIFKKSKSITKDVFCRWIKDETSKPKDENQAEATLISQSYKEYEDTDTNVTYFFCSFLRKEKPVCFKDDVKNICEEKVYFLLIAEYKNHYIINKKNVSDLSFFDSYLEPLEYKVFTRLIKKNATLDSVKICSQFL